MPKVSVIVPVYNVYEYIEKCLNSLVNQTLKDIEIIVVNDGSPDNSQEIIDKYAKKYKNIKSYTKVNGGLSDARNYGIKMASGEYIAFIDSDDYACHTMFEKMYNRATENDYDIVVCDTIEVYDNNRYVYKKSNFHYSSDDVKNYILSPPMACIRIYKRYLFDKIEFTKNIYYEDLNLTPTLIRYTKKIGFIEEPLYYYVQRNNSIMKQSKYSDKLLDIFAVLRHNKDLLYDNYPMEIEYLYITHLLRTATLRFLNYSEYNTLIDKIVNEMKEYFPKYNKNIYYKKSSFKLRLICFLAYHKNIKLLKFIKKFGGI